LEAAAATQQAESPVKSDFDAESIASLEVNILIAEDNPVNMLLTKKIVKKFLPKAAIFEAHNGEEAVAQFASRNIDLILMDIQMPELNGYEATIKIRNLENQQASVPIIALTASALNNERERCLAAGMNECTTKPIDQKALGDLVLKLLPEQVKQ
jgi:two-component system, NarL family, sensor histidine kinase BarA